MLYKTLVVCDNIKKCYFNFIPVLCISGLIATCIKLLLIYLLTYVLYSLHAISLDYAIMTTLDDQ